MKKIIGIAILLILLSGCTLEDIKFGSRTASVWNQRSTYLEPNKSTGLDLLVKGIDKYINFNTTTGSLGYGFRDNSGAVEYKNSGGAWAGVGSGGSSVAQLGQVGDVATTSLAYGYVLQWDGTSSWDSVATSSLGIAGAGTVTSVDMSVPTGLTIAGNPVTTSGTLALTLTNGQEEHWAVLRE